VGLLLLLVSVALAAAQDYAMDRWTIDGGAGQSSGGAYALSGTIGQPDAGSLSGGSYVLQGGFFSEVSGASIQRDIFLPVVVR